MTEPGRSRRARLKRRAVTIPSLVAIAIVATLLAPLWAPLVVVLDAVRMRFRFPLLRLGAFGVCWSWIEIAGVTRACWAWLTGRAGDATYHYELMKWWAGLMMSALGATTGIRPRLEQGEALEGGNAIVVSRHASLADSLLSAWAIRCESDLRPRYVLKKELLNDPCLDVVGLRVPNYFLDRQAADSESELDALRRLAAGVDAGTVGVIFAEGTRANDTKRARAIEKIAERDARRADRMRELRRLLPPRPAGTRAMVEGAPGADVVLAWHTGFDGLDSFGGIIDKLAKPLPPVRFVPRRVARADVPVGDQFDAWLDEQWLLLDGEVDRALRDTSP